MTEGKLFFGILQLNSFFEELGSLVFFKAMRRSLLLVFPLIVVGSFALCLLNFPFESVRGIMSESFRHALSAIVDGTYGITSLAMLCSMSLCLGEMYNARDEKASIHPFLYVVVASGSFFTLAAGWGISSFAEVTSLSASMPESIFTAYVSSWLLHRIVRLSSRLPAAGAGYDPFSVQVFSVAPACMGVLAVFALIRLVVNSVGFVSFSDMMQDLVMAIFALSDNQLFTGVLYLLLCQLLWFFGAHGPNMLHCVESRIFATNLVDNMNILSGNADGGNILTKGFVDAYAVMGGSGATLVLILALLLYGRNSRSRKFSGMALGLGLFNINEPLLFGIPLILNPVFMIPFILTPAILYSIAYGACSLGLIPLVTTSFHWTTPVFISGYYASGSWNGVIMQLILIMAGVCIYLPFVSLSDHMEEANFRCSMSSLLQAAKKSVASRACRCLSMNGEEGSVARSLAKDLLQAVRKKNQFFLVYQPQVNTEDPESLGAEALLRWNHPRFGFISPELTIALAEDLGCIEELSYFVLTEACKQGAEWGMMLGKPVRVSVNFTPSLITGKVAEKVSGVIDRTGFDPKCLEIEITESEALTSRRETAERLRELRRLGVRIAIDDFGMGHTSLRYLREMDVDKIKIDRSLTLESVTGINMHIVASILGLCRKLDLKVIIEGVETGEQFRCFREIGGDRFQGFYFSRPVSPDLCRLFFDKWAQDNSSVGFAVGREYERRV
ncbi:EAL domain-containing protein [Maridesulfovibrio sp.]|uniref:EAL domain-containing protein n=1 Tax=Maridesulfovibrio sp. TaxID=2795000 RepID=UPI002A18E390|nr:EAL domain-containing protein [Maridesulfovibrio sp.]